MATEILYPMSNVRNVHFLKKVDFFDDNHDASTLTTRLIEEFPEF